MGENPEWSASCWLKRQAAMLEAAHLGKSWAMAAMFRASAFFRQISSMPAKWFTRCTAGLVSATLTLSERL